MIPIIPLVASAILGISAALVIPGRKAIHDQRTRGRSRQRVGKKNARKKLRSEVAKGLPEGEALQHGAGVPSTKASDQEERVLDGQLMLATSGLGIAVLANALSAGALGGLSLPFLAFPLMSQFQAAKDALFRQRRVTLAVVDTVLIGGLVVTGHWLVLGLLGTLLALSRKLQRSADKGWRRQEQKTEAISPQEMTGWIRVRGLEVEVPASTMVQGDILVVRAGETIAADGIVLAGMGAIDQSLLTGDTCPVSKGIRDHVEAGSRLVHGQLYVQIEKSGEDTRIGRINKIVRDFQAVGPPRPKKWWREADRIALPVLGVVGVTGLLLGSGSAVAMLLALGGGLYTQRIVAPMRVLGLLWRTNQHSFIVKDGRVLKPLHEIDTVVLDRTLTWADDRLEIAAIHNFGASSEDAVMTIASSVEQRQTHSIARAILAEANRRNLALYETEDGPIEPGVGLRAQISREPLKKKEGGAWPRLGHQNLLVGSERFLTAHRIPMPDEAAAVVTRLRGQDRGIIWVAVDNRVVGALELQSSIRPVAQTVMTQLEDAGLSVYVLGGVHAQAPEQPALALTLRQDGLEDRLHEKVHAIQTLQKDGHRVCLVAAGVTDAAALRQADVAVSVVEGTSLARESAQLVLADKSLQSLPSLFHMSGRYRRDSEISLFLTGAPLVLGGLGVLTLHWGVLSVALLHGVGLGAGLGAGLGVSVLQTGHSVPGRSDGHDRPRRRRRRLRKKT